VIFEEIKSKTFISGRDKETIIETSNECECSCRGIINESIKHFKSNLGPDIRESQEADR